MARPGIPKSPVRFVWMTALGLGGAVAITSSDADANRPPGFDPPTTKPFPNKPFPKNPTPKGPDLVVKSLSVNNQCNLVATLRNDGTATVPSSIDDIALQFYENGRPLLGRSIQGNDLGALRRPGGQVTIVVPSFQVDGTTSIRARVDSTNRLREGNEKNNNLTKKLSCSPKQPDLKLVSISTDSKCRKVLEIQNVGDASPMDGAYIHDIITRKIDGVFAHSLSLATVDPEKRLRTPGAKITWVEPLRYRAYQSFEYTIDYEWPEKSETNNRRSGTPSGACKGTVPTYDLQPIDLTLDSNCRVVVKVRNNGPGSAAPAGVGVTFYRDGERKGVWTVDMVPLTEDGSTRTGVGPSHDGSGSSTWRAVVDERKAYPETHEGNNVITKTLQCGQTIDKPLKMAPGTLNL